MNDKCGCCEGIEPLTPRLISNRPGLNAPAYRIGTHASFLETMRARLSSYFLDIPQEGQDEHGQPDTERVYPLRNLTTRAADDPSIALLDAWATVGDVLTFYQERIANEGYLRTATERRSILELARLTGYALRPGVASTAYLAYTIDNNFKDEVIILAGARAQSAPGPGERPQTFETSEPLNARASWNTLKPRMTMPQTTDSIYNFLFSTGLNQQLEDALNSGQLTPVLRSAFEKQGIFLYPTGILVLKVQDGVWQIVDPGQDQSYVVIKVDSTSLNIYGPNDCVYLRGIATNLKPNDPLLVVVDGGPLLFRIKEVKLDAAADRTLIIFQSTAGLPPSTGLSSMAEGLRDRALEVVASEAPSEKTTGDVPKQVGKDVLFNVIQGLSKPPSVPPANTFQLIRNIAKSFSRNSDSGLQVVGAIRPDFKRILPLALSNVQVTPTNPLEVFALRLKTGVYGNTAPLEPIKDRGIVIGTREWPLDGIQTVGIMLGITVLNGGGMSGNATISVTNANADFRQTITLSSAAPTTVSLGGVNFTFSKMAGYPYTLNYQSNSGTTSLTYQPGHGTFSVTMNVNSQPPRTINIAFNQTTSITLQSHNLKIGYFMADDEAVVSVTDETLLPPEPKNQIALDGTYDQIVPGSWYVITRPNAPQQLAQVIGQIRDAQTVAKTDYNFPAKVTQLTLDQDWLTADDKLLSGIRSTTVFAQSEKLELAEEPIDPIKDAICGGADNAIELDGLYSDLKSGRWLIVTGERTDIRSPDPNDPGNPNKTVVVSGVRASELVMLSEVKHDVSMIGIHNQKPLPGDKPHTFIKLAKNLAYCYKRDTVTIYGNVAKATHGETRNEVLGSGDSAQVLQTFTLKQPPLTYVPASNPHGVDSTLHVRVNDVEWHEVENLAELSPTDRKFITRTTDDNKTNVIFGNGQQGARLPTGAENSRAVYRNGIGKAGNVQAEQISLLATRPLGVKEVINPLRASGGADKESRDQARKNASLPVLALDRLVSTQDYADFARGFAGIGKASAARLSDGVNQVVHITIAGADDIPIDKTSDLHHSLVRALRDFGDPHLPVRVEMRELILIVISANVRILPDYLWEAVVTKIRTKLLDTFSFERRELGQDVWLSEVVSAIQSVEGVAYVDVDVLGGVSEKNESGTLRTPQEIANKIQDMVKQSEKTKVPEPRIPVNMAEMNHPAQLAFLSSEVEATLILNEVTS